MIPERLYKYVSAERIDVLKSNRIRFSQPSALNDPTDLRIKIDRLIDLGLVYEWLGVPPSGMSRFVEEGIDSVELPDEVREHFTREELLREAQNPAVSNLVNGVISYIVEWMNGNREEFLRQLNEMVEQQIGVLSLTANPANLPMWAHYADGHRGFVIEFDARHQFFNSATSAAAEFDQVRSVSYTKDTTIPNLARKSPTDLLYFRKSEAWAYEAEWRLVRRFREPLDDLAPHAQVRLVDFPHDLITGVVFGLETPKETIDAVKNTARGQAIRLGQIELLERGTDLRVQWQDA